MKRTATIGNDIVDRLDAHNRRSAANPRYVRRVLSEREYVEHARAPDAELWLYAMWAAKEALHKATSGDGTRIPFLPGQTCIASLAGDISADQLGAREGQLRRTHDALSFSWHWDEASVHCLVAHPSLDGRWAKKSADGLAAPEASADAASCEVRELACDLAVSMGLATRRDTLSVSPRRSDRRRPVLLHNGQLMDNAMVSLTHDGRWMACALATTVRV